MLKRYINCSNCDITVDRYNPYSVSEGLRWFCNRRCRAQWEKQKHLSAPLLCYLALCIIALGFAAKYAFG